LYPTPDIGARSPPAAVLVRVAVLVIDSGGRTRLVRPPPQIAARAVRGVTAGFRSLGLQRRSGSAYRPVPRARHRPAAGWGNTLYALAELSPGADAATPTAGATTATPAFPTPRMRRPTTSDPIVQPPSALRGQWRVTVHE
jgi:hypothetical protein